MVFSGAAAVLVKGDVEDPRQVVLDGPMGAHGGEMHTDGSRRPRRFFSDSSLNTFGTLRRRNLPKTMMRRAMLDREENDVPGSGRQFANAAFSNGG
jgi:hypothetical protein